ncbi:MAG: S24/S26 family peptidase [Erysipelotrichaceae bacterium]|nr:S24/S26 family peptidase [Erysipelotrichaceae bacterium]
MEIKTVDTMEYVTTLRELTEDGHEVRMVISGNSMSPFIIHHRDSICFKKPDQDLKKGDIVFYQRDNGQYVCHRIYKVKKDGYYITGDNQNIIEGPIRRNQIFAIITKVNRKGKWIEPGDFWWEFFAKVWIRIVPLRMMIMKIYGICKKGFIS